MSSGVGVKCQGKNDGLTLRVGKTLIYPGTLPRPQKSLGSRLTRNKRA